MSENTIKTKPVMVYSTTRRTLERLQRQLNYRHLRDLVHDIVKFFEEEQKTKEN